MVNIAELNKLAIDIDYYIAKLQVYNFSIRINNYNLGDYHNIVIYRYKRKRLPFIGEYYKLEIFWRDTIRLPSDGDKLIKKFKQILYDFCS